MIRNRQLQQISLTRGGGVVRIMIVYDDPTIVQIVRRALPHQHHAIIVAQSGREAITLLRDERPGLIILDVLTPDINGIQVCRFVRAHPQLVSVPILLLTVKEDEDRIVGFEAGGGDYLTKPFHLDELELRVNALLRQTASGSPTAGTLAAGSICVDPTSGQTQVRRASVSLTPIDFELLYYMVSHAGGVISPERFLRDVWNNAPGSGNRGLARMRILNVRRKIEEHPRHPKLIPTVPRHGYVLCLPSPQ